MDCLFCAIANEDITSKKIYEDELVYAFLDIHPATPGHTLIIPKKHFQDLEDIDENTLLAILKAAKIVTRSLEDRLHCDGITLIQNNGAPQEVKHFHLHLKPFYSTKKEISLEEVYQLLH